MTSLAEMFSAHPGLGAPKEALLREGVMAAIGAIGGDSANGGLKRRDPKHRASFAGDPCRYMTDILGWRLTPQQEAAVALIETHDRVLIPSANNVGKTFLLGAYAVYRYDAVAALPDEERGLAEQGAQILLPGPDADTIFATIYSAILEHMARAESRGYAMPGRRSEKSVLCAVRPRWFMEAFSPKADAKRDVAHSASGRHHRNQVALIEEGQGVEERVWAASEGMCSGDGNKIVSSFNPTHPTGPAYQRERSGAYKSLHLSAMDHPNVRSRTFIIPEAVSYRVIDNRVRKECRDRGAYPDVQPDPDHCDFLYALPPHDEAEESGARTDGHRGHATGELHVYRPTPIFESQALGRWPRSSDSGLFDPGLLDAAMQRHRSSDDPQEKPDGIGVDCAREGDDDSTYAPRWGANADALLRAYADALKLGASAGEAVKRLQETRRIRVGAIRVLPKGDGPVVAGALHAVYPDSPWSVDETGVGTSVLDHARHVLRVDAVGVSFGALPPPPVSGEPWCENMRTAMYVRAAMLVRFGLVDIPEDPILREELLAHELLPNRWRSVEVRDPKRGMVKERKPSALLIAKDEIKKKIGRSPDRADAFVLALTEYKRKRTGADIGPIGIPKAR